MQKVAPCYFVGMTSVGSITKFEMAKKTGIHIVYDKPITGDQLKSVF